MSKIVAFMTSPRKNGYCSKVLNKVIEGAKSKGAEVVVYDLNEDGVKGCQGCNYCRKNEDCATKDKLQPMYEDIKEADAIVAAFPIYFYNISGQGKILIDRLYPVIDSSFAPRYPGKKAITIYAQGADNADAFKAQIDATNNFFKAFGWDVEKTFVVAGTSSPDFKLDDKLMEDAVEAGKALV